MKKTCVLIVVTFMMALPLVRPRAVLGQAPAHTRQPIRVNSGYLESQGARLKFARSNKMSEDGKAAVQQQRIVSVRNWSASFTFQGQVFPYTMVGNAPTRGGETHFDTQLIPISFFFDEFVDQNGNNIVIDVNPILPAFFNSPNFANAFLHYRLYSVW
jgi:hypothetical protein